VLPVTSTGRPAVEQILIAEESYRRCQGEAFFQAFYKRLLSTDAPIQHKFEHTDFDRQNRLLQHGIGLLFIFAKRPNPSLLQRIAERHGAHDLDIPPGLYPHFVESLVLTVREFDGACTDDVEAAWRTAVAPGIEFMRSRYRDNGTATDAV
jgi:hemoglobin-like flavoprotein